MLVSDVWYVACCVWREYEVLDGRTLDHGIPDHDILNPKGATEAPTWVLS